MIEFKFYDNIKQFLRYVKYFSTIMQKSKNNETNIPISKPKGKTSYADLLITFCFYLKHK